VTALGQLVLGQVAELGEQDSSRLAAAAMMTAGALWPHAQPSPAMQESPITGRLPCPPGGW
jgi:hypothetical protein